MGAFLLNIVLWRNNYYTYRFPEACQVSDLVNARPRESHVRRTHQHQSLLVTIRFCVCLTPICPGRIRVASLSRPTIHPPFKRHVLLHKNEIFSENIQKCPWEGPTSQHSEKTWEMMMNPHVAGYTETVNTPINSEKQQPTENQKNTKNEI